MAAFASAPPEFCNSWLRCQAHNLDGYSVWVRFHFIETCTQKPFQARRFPFLSNSSCLPSLAWDSRVKLATHSEVN